MGNRNSVAVNLDYLISDELVQKISQAVSEVSGIQLGAKQKSMVFSRLTKFLNEKGMSVESYLEYFEYHKQTELPLLVSLLTTHHTYFFREFAHFEFLENTALPRLVANAKKRGDRKITVWSAACSKGHEVYSLAMCLDRYLRSNAPDVSFSILGTDIDSQSVKVAQNGVYLRQETKEIPLAYLENHWALGRAELSQFIRANNSLKKHCTFRTENLFNPSAETSAQKFDLIFCRNVFIYLLAEQVTQICRNFSGRLQTDGYLFVGISESLRGLDVSMRGIGPSIYVSQNSSLYTNIESSLAKQRPQLSLVEPQANGNTSEPKTHKSMDLGQVSSRILRVVCVDDSPIILTLLKKILSSTAGFDVVGTASNGIEAHEKIAALKPDVVTLDIHMPEQNGIDYLAKRLNANHPPVVMVTSVEREDSGLALKALHLGAADYVEKPSLSKLDENSEELRTKLRTAFRFFDNHHRAKILPIDKKFSRSYALKSPHNALQVTLAHVSDRNRLGNYLHSFEGPQPAHFVLMNGDNNALKLVAEHLQNEHKIKINIINNKNFVAQPQQFYLANFDAIFNVLIEGYARNKNVSVIALGEIYLLWAEQLSRRTGFQLLLEENSNQESSKAYQQIKKLITDIVPFSSLAYTSNAHLCKKEW